MQTATKGRSKTRDLKEAATKAAKPQEKRALCEIHKAHNAMFALEELATSAGKVGINTYLVRSSARGLTTEASGYLAKARKAFSSGHPARKFLSKADAALADLVELVDLFKDADPKPGSPAEVVASRAMLGFVRDAGRWMERAEMSVNRDDYFSGWMDEVYVEGWQDFDKYRHPATKHIASASEMISEPSRIALFAAAYDLVKKDRPDMAEKFMAGAKDFTDTLPRQK